MRFPNPVRLLILCVGALLARVGLVDRQHVRSTTDLSWPRVVTGLARMSKNAADVAMVGVILGEAAIGGVGLASPFWGLAFSIGGGMAAGTIALVSQGHGAEDYDQFGQAIRSSVLVVLALTLPLAAVLFFFPTDLLGLLAADPATVTYGADYLRILAFGVPFAGLNLVGSRIYIGADDAYTPMLVRGGGAVSNIALNALFIFALGMGVTGAALGTVLANVLGTTAFAVGLARGRLPFCDPLPAAVSLRGRYFDRETATDIVRIGTPVVGRNGVWTVARIPLLAIVASFGTTVLAAYTVARRIYALMNTPGWGFGLASSSLVGQNLGRGDEAGAEAVAKDVILFSIGTYLVASAIVAAFAHPIADLFIGPDATPGTVPTTTAFVYVCCIAVLAQAVKGAAAGPLDAAGDTRVPFYSQLVGMFGFALPLAALGAYTDLGLAGLYLSLVAETFVPAAINYWWFSTGIWKERSREFRPGTPAND
ncbi:MATE family efflux transporter [Salarchaeum sp. JOR-1]|uniref:MATE family efflux transporter n=1 Tax=Salarchaeum sp. JOR-1 TaxID=2599399 RepID=UPI0011989154|nr:MATE family efflux transporter [Salarchaeum sp. JOR-1]QDX39977.1 MATE family efflux transporter [Salarchaeum sp. JOR-1]